MQDTLVYAPSWTRIYFYAWVLCGQFLILNLALAILLSAFESEEGLEDMNREDEQKVGAENYVYSVCAVTFLLLSGSNHSRREGVQKKEEAQFSSTSIFIDRKRLWVREITAGSLSGNTNGGC